MVNVTNEESFACKTVIVAAGTGCLAIVSKTTPLRLPLFCAELVSQIIPDKAISKIFFIHWLVFPKTIGIGYENILRKLNTRLSRVEIMLMKVNAVTTHLWRALCLYLLFLVRKPGS